MELWQYIALQRTQDRSFTQTKFALLVNCSLQRMSTIIHYKVVPSIRLAMDIEKISGGKVNGWDLIKRCVEARDKKRQGSPPNRLIKNGGELEILPHSTPR